MKKLLHPFVFVPFPPSVERTRWDASGPAGHERQFAAQLSGRLKCTLTTFTKLCLKSNFQSLAARGETPYIPGSSLKGMVRNMLQMLGEGCAGQQFGDKKLEEVERKNDFKLDLGDLEPCTKEAACLTCRLFGYSLKKESHDDDEPFGWSGKLRFFDTGPLPQWTQQDWVALNQGAFGIENWPKARPSDHGPRHLPFYFPNGNGKPAGWKLYRHANNIREVDETQGFGSPYCVRGGMSFHFTIEFENLSPEEFAIFKLALTLQHTCPQHDGSSSIDLVHKLGYGKGVGMGGCSVRIEDTQFESLERFLEGSTTVTSNLPKCGIEEILERDSWKIIRQARSKTDAAHLLVYPPQSWFKIPKGTIASFDESLIQKPPRLIALAPPVQQAAPAKSFDALPENVKMIVTSIKSGKIKAETADLYNGKKYRCELVEDGWRKPVSTGDKIMVGVKPRSTNHKAQEFEGGAWIRDLS